MKTRRIAITSIGIALYVVLSMMAKIPVIAHISLDLGYIVFAMYCYYMGASAAMIVGGAGCVLVSLLTTGWFPPGWLVGNLIIGLFCGILYQRETSATAWVINIIDTIVAVTIGIFCAKTIIECKLYNIPYVVKLPKNAIACVMDTAVMICGLLLAHYKPIAKVWKNAK